MTELWSDLRGLLGKTELIAKDLEFFSTISICNTYISNTAYRPIPFLTRYDKTGANRFFSKTINSTETVPRLLSMLLAKYVDSTASRADGPSQGDGGKEPLCVTFAQLGPDVGGFQDTLHGGVMASLLDESIGLCAEAYREFVAKDSLSRLYTANLEISYRAPVPAPGILVIETWLKKKEGRKYFLEARVLSENGNVMVEAKSLYISARSPAAL